MLNYIEKIKIKDFFPGKKVISQDLQYNRALVKSAYQKKYFLISQSKTYVMGTQKNRLNETVLSSTQNIC